MNAVWLSDELMVTPGAVAGLIAQSEDDSYGQTYGLSRWVSIVLLGGELRRVWNINAEIPIGDGGEGLKFALARVRAEQKTLAEVEMLRLSELLWPEPADVLFKGWVTDAGGGEVRMLVDRDTESYPELNIHVEVRALP